jgi:hypothetical protein
VRYLLKLDSRRTINEVIWGFVFCAEADIAWRGQSVHNARQLSTTWRLEGHAPSIVTRAAPRPSSPRNLRNS